MLESELLLLLHEVTLAKKLTWKHVSTDRYEAERGGFLYFIEQEAPVLLGGSPAFTTMYRVGVAEALITFADGSPLVEILEKILAAAFDEWSEHVRFADQFRTQAGDRLKRMLEDG